VECCGLVVQLSVSCRVVVDLQRLASRGEKINRNKCSAVAEMGDRWATTDGPKIGGCAPFLGEGELASHLSQRGLSRDLPTSVPSGTLIHPTVWPQ